MHPILRQHPRRILLVGSGILARVTVEDLRRSRYVDLLGAVPLTDEPTHPELGVALVSDLDGLQAWLEAHHIDEIYLAADVVEHRATLQRVIALCERLGVPFALPAHSFRMQRALPARASVAADGFLHYEQHTAKRRTRLVKRGLDFVAAAAGLLVLSPLLLASAIAIRLESKGPILFRQVRIGRNGRPFRLLKLRSMVADAEQRRAALEQHNEHREGPVFKMTDDPRITRVGRFLRRSSIDELPQLWNVLRGEMSLVGPRPPLAGEVNKYDAWQRRRLSVTPGLTGIWQVSGRNSIGFDQWMRLDLQYIDNWSLGLDLSLIGRTIPVVFTGRGAS